MTHDPRALTRAAFGILVADLEGHGNVLSDMHRAALFELLETFTSYLVGETNGRRAFGLPTGLGKTSAIVAHLTAMHQLGWDVPVSVAASKVEALCNLKRQLIAHGVPEALIGIKHSLMDASELSTGAESRLFQLVTHSRVRSGRDFALFGEHNGQRRPLCIYDETLMRSDVFAFSETSMRKAMALLSIELEKRTDPLTLGLMGYLTEAAETIAAALAHLRADGDSAGNGVPVDLGPLEEPIVEAYRLAVRRAGPGLGSWSQELESLLSVSQEALQVLTAEQGGGVIAVREAVPAALRNVVILDASTAVRELVKLDPTVKTEQSFAAEDLKTYEAVEVHQLLASGGRGSIEWSFKAKAREASAVSREVIDIIKATEGTAKAYLIFSFLPRRGQVDVLAELRQDLSRAGIDLGATTSLGKPRFEWLTWGQQESLNGYEHCDVVIMAGVLHRSHLDLAAAVKGQTGHLSEPTPSDRIRQIVRSEVAHVVLQGASRGSCRRITNGKAHPMRLYLIHRDASLRFLLDRVMPGAAWSYPVPKHLALAKGEGKATDLLGQLLAFLTGVKVDRISSKRTKAEMGLGKDNATRLAFVRCLELLDHDEHGWVVDGRSFLRASSVSPFVDLSEI